MKKPARDARPESSTIKTAVTFMLALLLSASLFGCVNLGAHSGQSDQAQTPNSTVEEQTEPATEVLVNASGAVFIPLSDGSIKLVGTQLGATAPTIAGKAYGVGLVDYGKETTVQSLSQGTGTTSPTAFHQQTASFVATDVAVRNGVDAEYLAEIDDWLAAKGLVISNDAILNSSATVRAKQASIIYDHNGASAAIIRATGLDPKCKFNENLYKCWESEMPSAAHIMNKWWASESHKATLEGGYQYYGLDAYNNGEYWVFSMAFYGINRVDMVTAPVDQPGAHPHSDAAKPPMSLMPEKPTDSTDADGDGVADTNEAIIGADPTKADTDGDGFGDLDELIAGSDPTDATSKPIVVVEDLATSIGIDQAAFCQPDVPILVGRAPDGGSNYSIIPNGSDEGFGWIVIIAIPSKPGEGQGSTIPSPPDVPIADAIDDLPAVDPETPITGVDLSNIDALRAAGDFDGADKLAMSAVKFIENSIAVTSDGAVQTWLEARVAVEQAKADTAAARQKKAEDEAISTAENAQSRPNQSNNGGGNGTGNGGSGATPPSNDGGTVPDSSSGGSGATPPSNDGGETSSPPSGGGGTGNQPPSYDVVPNNPDEGFGWTIIIKPPSS